MPAQIFGAPAVAVQLYIAFYGAAPSNPIYNNLVGVAAASSTLNLALTVGDQFKTVGDSALATQVLTNLGITATTIPAASYTALQTALTAAFAAYPTQRGIVVMNAMNILTSLETDATFGTVAQTFNQSVTNAYVYASNTANTQTQTLGGITTTSPLTVNAGDIVTGTSGNDSINGNLFFNTPSGTFFQTLNTGDTVNGGAGTDILNVGFNNGAAQTISATLTSIEGIALNATGTTNTTVDMTNGTGLSTVSLTNGAAGGDLVLSNVQSTLSAINLANTQAGLVVTSAAAAVAGTADTIAVSLSQVGGTTVASPILAAAGYEIFNITSSGPAANAITLSQTGVVGTAAAGAYSANATFNVAGTQSVTVTTGTSTNAVNINASGMTGSGALTVTATGAASNINVTGTANGDTVSFGGTYNTNDTYAGGAGNDTISLNEASVVGVTANQANLSALEIVQFATAAAAAGTYTPAVFGGATTLALVFGTGSANAMTVNYGAGTAGLSLTSTSQTGAITLNSTGSATTDVVNITTNATSTAVGAGNLVHGTVATNGFETANISSGGALGQTNTFGAITMLATAASEVINISGTRDLSIGAVTADQVNASAFTANLNMTAASASAALSNGVAVTNAGVQITGGAGNDTLFGSSGADQINGGAGNDRILFAGTSVAGTGTANQGDIATGGAGTDQFRFVGATQADLLQQSAGTAQVVKITDFVAGTDKIGLIGGGFTSVSLAATQTIASAADLTAVYAGITAIAASTATNASAVAVVVSSGLAAGVYLYVNDATAGVSNTTDMLINITGITGNLTAADFTLT